MLRLISALVLAVFGVVPAYAVEIPFMGGGTVVAVTAGCSWPQLNNHWNVSYFFPIPGSTNGTASTVSFYGFNSSEAFQLQGSFTTTLKNVQAFHDFTRAGTYSAQVALAAAQPAVNVNTRYLNLQFILNKFDNKPTCKVTVDAALVRSPQ